MAEIDCSRMFRAARDGIRAHYSVTTHWNADAFVMTDDAIDDDRLCETRHASLT